MAVDAMSSDIVDIRRLYEEASVETDGNWHLSRQDLRDFQGSEALMEWRDQFLTQLESSGDNFMTWSEGLAFVDSNFSAASSDREVPNFNWNDAMQFDANGNDHLELQEWLEFREATPDTEVEEIWSFMQGDQNGSGRFGLDEYNRLLDNNTITGVDDTPSSDRSGGGNPIAAPVDEDFSENDQESPTQPSPSESGSAPSDAIRTRWGGEDVKIWDITKDNATDSGITSGADVFLVTVNDTSLSGLEKLAESNGYQVIETTGKSDAGTLLLRPEADADPAGFEEMLDFGKVTVTAVDEPEGKRLEPNGGGFETRPNSGMGFGTTDNTDTRGEFFLTTGGNSKIERNGEDDGRLWQSGRDMHSFRGGWMGLEWS